MNSCSNETVLASVNDHELTEADAKVLMKHLGYDFAKPEDLSAFVEKWVDAMVMQDEIEEMDPLKAKVADFRSSLFKGELSQYFLTCRKHWHFVIK